jgi:hypothetical protein
LSAQAVEVVAEDRGARLFAPVTSRGEAVGVLELGLDDFPVQQTVADVALAGHFLAYVVIANRRYTDLFEWGQRSVPLSLAAEIQGEVAQAALSSNRLEKGRAFDVAPGEWAGVALLTRDGQALLAAGTGSSVAIAEGPAAEIRERWTALERSGAKLAIPDAKPLDRLLARLALRDGDRVYCVGDLVKVRGKRLSRESGTFPRISHPSCLASQICEETSRGSTRRRFHRPAPDASSAHVSMRPSARRSIDSTGRRRRLSPNRCMCGQSGLVPAVASGTTARMTTATRATLAQEPARAQPTIRLMSGAWRRALNRSCP